VNTSVTICMHSLPTTQQMTAQQTAVICKERKFDEEGKRDL